LFVDVDVCLSPCHAFSSYICIDRKKIWNTKFCSFFSFQKQQLWVVEDSTWLKYLYYLAIKLLMVYEVRVPVPCTRYILSKMVMAGDEEEKKEG
jgi:hypothetical protein